MKRTKLFQNIILILVLLQSAFCLSVFEKPWGKLLDEASRNDHYFHENGEIRNQQTASVDAKSKYLILFESRGELNIDNSSIILDTFDGRKLNSSYFQDHELIGSDSIFLFPGRHVLSVRIKKKLTKEEKSNLVVDTDYKVSPNMFIEFFSDPREKYHFDVVVTNNNREIWIPVIRNSATNEIISDYLDYRISKITITEKEALEDFFKFQSSVTSPRVIHTPDTLPPASTGNLFFYTESLDNNQRKDAMSWLEKESENGNIQAKSILGKFYLEGSTVAQNNEKAFRYFKEASDSGDPNSQGITGWMYEKGIGTAKNYNMAKKYYQMSFDNGNVNVKKYLDKLDFNMNIKNG